MGKNLSLGTWPTTGEGFESAKEAWAEFWRSLAQLKSEGAGAEDSRVVALAEGMRQVYCGEGSRCPRLPCLPSKFTQ